MHKNRYTTSGLQTLVKFEMAPVITLRINGKILMFLHQNAISN